MGKSKGFTRQNGQTDSIVTNMIKLRVNSGFTQRGLSERIDVKNSTITNVECGNIPPSLKMVREYSDFFGVTMDSICRPYEVVLPNVKSVVYNLQKRVEFLERNLK